MKTVKTVIENGTKVNIKSAFQQAGDWGIVIGFDGEDYHVAMMGDTNTACVFARSEFTIRRMK